MPDIYAIGLVIVLALAFDFINGFHDTANAIATCIATPVSYTHLTLPTKLEV